jgi:hypothetical protein
MVAEHYQRLGFTALPAEPENDQRFELRLDAFNEVSTFIEILEN